MNSVDQLDKYKCDYPVGRTHLFTKTKLTNADFYDFDTNVVTPVVRSKMDFSTTVLPDRCVTKNELVTFDEVADLIKPP